MYPIDELMERGQRKSGEEVLVSGGAAVGREHDGIVGEGI